MLVARPSVRAASLTAHHGFPQWELGWVAAAAAAAAAATWVKQGKEGKDKGWRLGYFVQRRFDAYAGCLARANRRECYILRGERGILPGWPSPG